MNVRSVHVLWHHAHANWLTPGVAATVTSVLALLFAVLSFWWMNWRRGKLTVGGPRAFFIARTGDAIMISLPLAFINDGAVPWVVRDLRLLIEEFGGAASPFNWEGVAQKLNSIDGLLATQFIVPARGAASFVAQFLRDPAQATFGPQAYHAELRAKLETEAEWRSILAFRLYVSPRVVVAANGGGIAIDNERAEGELHAEPSTASS